MRWTWISSAAVAVSLATAQPADSQEYAKWHVGMSFGYSFYTDHTTDTAKGFDPDKLHTKFDAGYSVHRFVDVVVSAGLDAGDFVHADSTSNPQVVVPVTVGVRGYISRPTGAYALSLIHI